MRKFKEGDQVSHDDFTEDYVSIGTNKYWYAEDKDLKLIKAKVSTEIEVGDTVEYLDCKAIIGCIHDGHAFASFYKNNSEYNYKYRSGGTCSEHETFMGYPIDRMKLISKGSKIPHEQVTCSGNVLQNGFMGELGEVKIYKEGQPLMDKIKTTMTNIKDFVKTSLLSKEEKLLRKHGFKQAECGEYTEAAKQFAIEALCKQQEAEMLKVAEGMEAEEKDSK